MLICTWERGVKSIYFDYPNIPVLEIQIFPGSIEKNSTYFAYLSVDPAIVTGYSYVESDNTAIGYWMLGAGTLLLVMR